MRRNEGTYFALTRSQSNGVRSRTALPKNSSLPGVDVAILLSVAPAARPTDLRHDGGVSFHGGGEGDHVALVLVVIEPVLQRERQGWGRPARHVEVVEKDLDVAVQAALRQGEVDRSSVGHEGVPRMRDEVIVLKPEAV